MAGKKASKPRRGLALEQFMKLIIINGPCGVGKSTVAKSLHATMPLSFLFDIDALMRHVSGYNKLENRERRRTLMLALAEAILDTCFQHGHDVILDKMIFREDILEAHIQTAKRHGAEIHEIILWAPKDVVMQRAIDRGFHEGGLLTPEKCELFWEKIDELRKTRPNAKFIDTSALTEQRVIEAVKKVID